MRVALITDTHFGLRGNSPYFLNRQKEFFEKVFFPEIDKRGIDTIIHLGDVFDKRPLINFVVLNECKNFFFKEIEKRNLRTIFIVGNHDCPFRDTNFPNSVRLLLSETSYEKYEVYDSPTTVDVGGYEICLIPWVNKQNASETKRLIETTNSKYLFGHLEIQGFQMLRGVRCESGFERKYLSNFQRVFSGHFHHRSSEDNVFYLGNPYETTWADYGNQKGFHIFDLKKDDLTLVKNPYISHVEISSHEEVKKEIVSGKIVKVNLKDLAEDEINKIYNAFDILEDKPEDVVFMVNSKFNKESNYVVEDLEMKTTKELLDEYVSEGVPENIDVEKLKLYMNELHDQGMEL